MRRARTRRACIEERTLRIGFRIKWSLPPQIDLPQLLALQPALGRRETIPLRPLMTDKLFRRDPSERRGAAVARDRRRRGHDAPGRPRPPGPRRHDPSLA